MIHQRFIDYFEKTFFEDNPEELETFLCAIESPIPRTIRIKPGKEQGVKSRLEKDGWILHDTSIHNVFSLDRRDDFDPLERRIGFSFDHVIGNFYIQELAAAHPVNILADGKIHNDDLLILDMASSPGGKTTQLAEYFPGSFIVANEPGRERIPQLLQNLERMGTPNVGITLYPGQHWKNFPETFDRVLLDAPCSGEGTLYKGTDATKHWHIKNIKQIAHLQYRLVEAAVTCLKTGGEMVYSTCALNLFENEEIIENLTQKYPGHFEILFQKKFWPHIDKTGGFFVTKIKKVKSFPEHIGNTYTYQANNDLKVFRGNLGEWNTLPDISLYEHDNKILATKNSNIGEKLRSHAFFMRWGEIVGYKNQGKFAPNHRAHQYIDTEALENFIIPDEHMLDEYLRGNTLQSTGVDGYVTLIYQDTPLGIEKREKNTISNSLPKEWQRK